MRPFFLIYFFTSFSSYLSSPTFSNDLESGRLPIDIVQIQIHPFDNNNNGQGNSTETSSDNANIGTRRSDHSNLSTTSETMTLNLNEPYRHYFIPTIQHMASFPTWFLIFFLSEFSTYPSIFVKVINFFAFYALIHYIQKFFGYEVVLSLRNFPCFVKFERIHYSDPSEEMVTYWSQWAMVPFAWFNEFLLTCNDNMKANLNYFTYVPDKSILMVTFLIQLLYIYFSPSSIQIIFLLIIIPIFWLLPLINH